MKKCSCCGFENLDEAAQCAGCHAALTAPTGDPPRTKLVTAQDEARFWERMTFRQFAALWLRLQAIWLLFYAATDLTHIPVYIGRSYEGGIYINPGERLGFFLLVLRIILHVIAAVDVIQYADRVLSWLVRDWIRNQPSNPSSEPTANEATRSATRAAPEGGGGSVPSR